MKKMLIDANLENEVRVAIVEGNNLIDYESEKVKNERIKGNIYLAKIVRVEPSLQAAFVDYGGNKHGFLAYNEIHPDYFKIPTADKKKLLEQELQASQNININEEEESEPFVNESFQENQNANSPIDKNLTGNEGFLSRIFDFFNYKPLDDFSTTRVKRKRSFKPSKKNKPIIFHRKYTIQEVIKSNQVILIQVVKEERGNKGAAVTTRLSLAGKYCVLMPNTNKGGGISRKIADLKLRKRLKEVVSKLKIKAGMGVIIRTAGESMGLKEIKRDYNTMIKLWKEITSKTIKSNAPCLIHEEDNLITRCLRDYFDATYESIYVNNKQTLIKCKEIVKQFMPQSVKQIKFYKDKKPLFFNQGIEKKIVDINNPVVNLKSGGYLVINQTEALVAIDINSGKFTKNRNIEDTAFQTNLEAAEEISRQIKIRDLAGLVVIDFIDMLERNHNFKVEKRLKDFLKNDRARIQIGRISSFGLLELSRQRLKVTEDSKISQKCSHCNGYGSSPSYDFLSNQILRVYNEICLEKPQDKISVLCNEILGEKLNECNLKRISNKQNIKIQVFNKLNNFDFIICKYNEVLYKNFNSDVDLELLNKVLKIKKNDKSSKKNEKTYDNTKKINEKIIPLENKLTKSDEKNNEANEEVMKLKRKSYRKKVTDLKGKRNSKNISSKRSKERQDQNIEVLKEQEKTEKRQGWWSQ
ncbi:MAG: Rne/Rng family ribonuclease [Alphaproteobacteria bacterium]